MSNPFDPTIWRVLNPKQFIDKRMRLTRESGIVNQHVRAYHGALVRKGTDGKAEYAYCVHAHSKVKAARQCAEREARKRNRLGDYWLTEGE